MPVLENERHEAFAMRVALGTPYATAYMSAGFEACSRDVARVNASRLVTRDDVKARIDELRVDFKEVVEKDHGVTRDWLMHMLERNIAIAYGVEPYAVVMEPMRDAEGKVKHDDEGKVVMMPTAKYRYEPAAANKSLELLGQLKGEFRKFDGTLRGDPNNPLVTRLDVAFVGPLADALTKAVPNG